MDFVQYFASFVDFSHNMVYSLDGLEKYYEKGAVSCFFSCQIIKVPANGEVYLELIDIGSSSIYIKMIKTDME